MDLPQPRPKKYTNGVWEPPKLIVIPNSGRSDKAIQDRVAAEWAMKTEADFVSFEEVRREFGLGPWVCNLCSKFNN